MGNNAQREKGTAMTQQEMLAAFAGLSDKERKAFASAAAKMERERKESMKGTIAEGKSVWVAWKDTEDCLVSLAREQARADSGLDAWLAAHPDVTIDDIRTRRMGEK